MGTLIAHRQLDVLGLARERRNRKPNGIRPVPIDQVLRIATVPLRLTHRLPEAVEDFRMHMHVRERDHVLRRHLSALNARRVLHVVEPREHHPGNPQRDDVPRRDQHAAGVEVVENFVFG